MTRTALRSTLLPGALLVLLATLPPCRLGAGAPPEAVQPANTPTEAPAAAWPMARGSLTGTGRSAGSLRLPLVESWKRSFDTGFEATPVIADGVCFIGDLDGGFHALRLDSGETVWSIAGDSRSVAGFPAAAAIAGGGEAIPVVVAGDGDGTIRALDRRTGGVVWTHSRGGEISGGPTVMPSPAGDRILVGSQDATLVCLDAATGRTIWEVSIADQIRSSPTVAAGRALIAGCDGRLHVIDAETGRETAAVAIDGPTGTTPAALGSLACFGSEGGIFWGIDVGAGSVRWQSTRAAGGPSYRSSAAIGSAAAIEGNAGGWLAIVGTRGRAVEAFSIADGSLAWRAPMRGRVDGSPAVVRVGANGNTAALPEAAIVADAAGVVRLLGCSGGEVLWEFDAGGGFTASAAVADGRIVLPGEDGSVWCFAGRDGA
jgi:outer membrane protein assembly factor BamB